MKRKRKNYQPKEKLAILKRHLVDKEPVSDLCDKYDHHPTVFYQWKKEFFEHGAAAFERDSVRQKNKEAERIRELEQKLQHKNEVLSELMEEHLKVKRNLWGIWLGLWSFMTSETRS